MIKKLNLVSNVVNGGIAALLACIPVFFYIHDASYTQSWLIYVGSFFFAVVIAVHLLRESKRRGGNESTVFMVFESHVTVVIGVFIACVICFLLLSTMVPGYLSEGPAGKVMTDAPPNSVEDKTNGLSFKVFMGAILFNFSMGSFVSIVYPFYAKRNQKKDSGEPAPLHQEGVTS
jgi:hypothetical protein